MSLKFSTAWKLVAAGTVVVGLAIAWRFAFFVLPLSWTGEPARLAQALQLQPGMHVADIGAGSGALAVAMVPFVGSSGQVYATELDAERLADIEERVQRAGLHNVRVIAAGETETRLPESCCDAVYMRAVFHHVSDRTGFAASVVRALRPDGRVAVIDFAPGTLWFLDRHHGVSPDSVSSAFEGAGLRLRSRDDQWGGGMFLLAFDREGESQPIDSELACEKCANSQRPTPNSQGVPDRDVRKMIPLGVGSWTLGVDFFSRSSGLHRGAPLDSARGALSEVEGRGQT